MDYLVHKYISLSSSQLRNFKKKGENLYNFSCPYCGDSKKNNKRARGYIYEKDGHTSFFCQKCKVSRSIGNFLKELNSSLYDEFLREKFVPKAEVEQPKLVSKAPKFYDMKSLRVEYSYINSINNLANNDPFRQYVIDRKIPTYCYDILFKCDLFKEFTNKLLPGKFSQESLKKEEQRLLIPFFTKDKKVFGYTGRSIEENAFIRYINIYLDESHIKLYGLDRWDQNKKTYVVEGPIDSLFLDNCLATSGNDMVASLQGLDKDQFILIYDNEPRSPTTKSKIERAINAGYKVCIFPKYFEQKDINEMILNGMTKQEITNVVDNNTFKNLMAMARLINR